MSDDLISRKAAIEALGEEPEVWSGKDEYEQGLNNQWHYDITAIEAVPSVQERKKGRWMTDVAFYDEEGCPCIVTRCDKCGEVAEMTAYCPHCGAEMERAEDE